MPKQNHIISRFNGLVLDIAKEDLPDGVLANNTRNVHFDESGNLIGFTPPQGYLTTGISSPVYVGKYKSPSGTRTFHIEGTATRTIKTYATGSTAVQSVNLSHNQVLGDRLSHVQRLNHMVIGTGNGQPNKPVWFGTHNHVQFGNAPSATPSCIDAELVSPTQLSMDNSFPRAIGVARTGSRTFMISADSPKVFKFNNTTKEAESNFSFSNPAAICADIVDGFFWVYDQQGNAIYRMNANMEVQSSIFLSGFPMDDKIVIDMIVADGQIWLLRDFPEKGYHSMEGWLFRVQRTTRNTNAQVTNNSYSGFANNVFDAYDTGAGTFAEVRQLLMVRIRFGQRALFVKNNTLYVALKLQTDWMFFYEAEYDEHSQDYNYNSGTGRIENFTGLYLSSKPTPQSIIDTGNTVFVPIAVGDSPGRFSLSETNLIVGQRNIVALDWLTYDGSNVDLYNYGYNDNVQRIRFSLSSLTGDTHLSPSVTAIPGFASNQIQPVMTAVSGTGYFFNSVSPAKAGILAGTSLASITESIASLNLEPIPGGFSDEERTYYYAFSFLYDGYMESPLSEFVSARASKGSGFIVSIRIPTGNINRRVNAINIYRASGSQFGREEFFRLVDMISFEPDYPNQTVDGQATKVIEYNDRKAEFELGASFEANAGIPETMQRPFVHYGMSEVIDDYMFVADCWHPDISEAKYMLFRSLPYSICAFNVETDVLRLPGIPTAMVSYNNRLLVFDEEDMHIVDPANMVIENTINGLGAINRRCVKKFSNGVFIAGNRHLSLFSGGRVSKVSERIVIHSGANLSSFSVNPAVSTYNALRDYVYLVQNGANLHLTVNEIKSEVLLAGTISGATIGYLYNFETQQWSRYVRSSYTMMHSIADEDGNLLAYRSNGIDYLFGNVHPGAAGTEYVAELVPFDGGDANIIKWYYQIRIDYFGPQNNINVRVSTDNSDYSANLTQSPQGVFTIPSAHYKGKEIRIRIEGSVKVKSVSLIFRPKQVRS